MTKLPMVFSGCLLVLASQPVFSGCVENEVDKLTTQHFAWEEGLSRAKFCQNDRLPSIPDVFGDTYMKCIKACLKKLNKCQKDKTKSASQCGWVYLNCQKNCK